MYKSHLEEIFCPNVQRLLACFYKVLNVTSRTYVPTYVQTAGMFFFGSQEDCQDLATSYVADWCAVLGGRCWCFTAFTSEVVC